MDGGGIVAGLCVFLLIVVAVLLVEIWDRRLKIETSERVTVEIVHKSEPGEKVLNSFRPAAKPMTADSSRAYRYGSGDEIGNESSRSYPTIYQITIKFNALLYNVTVSKNFFKECAVGDHVEMVMHIRECPRCKDKITYFSE